jgi:hypothetical protein
MKTDLVETHVKTPLVTVFCHRTENHIVKLRTESAMAFGSSATETDQAPEVACKGIAQHKRKPFKLRDRFSRKPQLHYDSPRLPVF